MSVSGDYWNGNFGAKHNTFQLEYCYKDNDLAAACLVADTDHVLIVGLTNSICIDAQSIPIIQTRTAAGNMLIKNRIKTVSKV